MDMKDVKIVITKTYELSKLVGQTPYFSRDALALIPPPIAISNKGESNGH